MPSKNKKPLDIIPPQPPDEAQREPSQEPARQPKQKKSPASFLLVICLLVLLVGVAAYFLIPRKAKLAVVPKIEEVSLNVTKEISGNFLPKEEASEEKYYSFGTEEVEKRAEGVIRVHNDYHLDQILVADTRFWCRGEESLEFKTKERVTIPAKAYLDVEVRASQPGEEFNIEPCSVFSVPGLVGTARYTAVYGESLSAMQGGEEFIGVLVVAKSQLQDLAREYVLGLDLEQRIKEGSLQVSYSSPSADLEEEKVTLDLEITAEVYSAPDQENLKKAVRGLDAPQIEELIVDFPEIAEIRLSLWPFWVNRVPNDTKSIDISLNI